MNQLSLFEEPKSSSSHVTIMNGEYIFIPNFLSNTESDAYFKTLLGKIAWKQESMSIYGKQVNFPRLTAWYGDNDKPYAFSGIKLNPEPWTNSLLEIKNKLAVHSNVGFNSVLLNLYRNGNDSISWHTDAEKELGTNPVIASVNFGASRKFQLRHRTTNEKIELLLTHGSLLIMQGELQHHWQHQVPKTKQKLKERINLTFRAIQ